MPYYHYDAAGGPALVICDACLTIEETVRIWLPPYGVRSPDLADCVHTFQKDPWCWAPIWGDPDLTCPRCGDLIDPHNARSRRPVPEQTGATTP